MGKEVATKWIGKSVKRLEDARLLTGRGRFVDDLKLPDLQRAAILRSPHAHARINRIDASEALKLPGVISVLTGEDVVRMSDPFPHGVPAEISYYSLAVDKARFVGEPVAVVVAKDRYVAEDATALIQVDYEPLPAVTGPEEALAQDAPVLHESVGNNIAHHRLLTYGDIDAAFKEADVVVKEKFRFPKYSSTPIETYAIIASRDPLTGVVTVWSNFIGPFIMHPVVAKALRLPESKLRFIVPPDIGGAFGIKVSIYPYIALIALASMKCGQPVKWIEDRREHLLASSSGTDRVSYLEAALKKDGTILGIRQKIMDNVGGYLRTPEPGCLYRTAGNYVGPYKFCNLQMDSYAVLTNKSLTGPNRGYGCQQLYFGLERLVDRAANQLNIDPAQIRLRNFIPPQAFPYNTPSGGIYDSGDYPAALRKALEMSGYDELRKEQREARAKGKLFGVGIACAVDPSVTNMAYILLAWPPEERAKADFLLKSGSSESATIKIDPLGKIMVLVSSTPQGQGHETIVAQVVAEELGVPIDDITIISEMDTFTRTWGITSGGYSSRFASVGTSAFAIACRKMKEKVLKIAAPLLEADVEDLEMQNGLITVKGSPERRMPLRRVAGVAHWNPSDLPEGIEPRLQLTYTFNFPRAKTPDEKDRVNSSNTYGFIAEVVALELEPETALIKILKYATVHDAGTILNPKIVEGQIYGSLLHGLGGAIYEELAYDEDGQMLTATFMDYLCPTAVEAPTIDIGHIVSPSPFSVLGAKGCGESSSMTAPVAIANAVEDALSPLGIKITELPLPPDKLWRMIKEAKG